MTASARHLRKWATPSTRVVCSIAPAERTHASLATPRLDKVKKQKSDRLKAALVQAEDTLKPDAEEEAVHILIDDDFAFTTQDVVALVRLRQPTNTGLEEHVDIDELEADSSPLNSPLNSPMRPGLAPRKKRGRHQQLHARFIVLVLGGGRASSRRNTSASSTTSTSTSVWKSTSVSGALAPSSGEEPAPPRHRAGAASMA